MLISIQVQYYGASVGVIALTIAKGSSKSGKFTLKILSESGKLLTVGCRFPSK